MSKNNRKAAEKHRRCVLRMARSELCGSSLQPNRGVTDMKYNERIRELREDKSLTQQRIADLLHIGQRTYADYESGKTRIPVDSLLILARFYNVSMDYITGAGNRKKPYPAD